MNRKFVFTGISKLTLSHEDGTSTSSHEATDIRLEISNNLDNKKYLNRGLPTKEGIKPLSQCFIQGLVANIHNAHQLGYWDSAEHLRYIIKELERGFVNVATVSEGKM